MRKHLLFLFLFFPFILSAQHTLSGKFSPANNYEFVILYRVTPTQMVYEVNGAIEKDGTFKLTLDSSVKPGAYKLVYNLPEENNNLDIIYNGKEDISLTYSFDQGVKFESGQNKILNDYLKKMEDVQQSIQMALKSGTTSKPTMDALIQRQLEIQSNAEKAADPLTLVYIQALKPYIPQQFDNKGSYEMFRKTQFFENFDFNKIELQSSGYPLELLKEYYHEFVTLAGGTGYRAIMSDIYHEIADTDKAFQKSLLTDFYQFLMGSGRQNAANFLAQNYLIELARSQKDNELADRMQRILNTTLGATAPNFALKGFDESKSLYDLKDSAYYALIFWSSECSHCVEQVPQIHKEIESIPTGSLQVIAVGIEIEADNWNKMTQKFPKFINVLALDEWRDDLVQEYAVSGTPTFYIVDKNKKIVSKPRGTVNFLKEIEQFKQVKK